MARFPDTPNPDATADAVKAVKAGKINLADLTAAMRYVIENGGAVVLWELDCGAIPVLADEGLLGNLIIRPGELTIGEQCAIVDDTGQGWDGFNPQTDPRHLRALLTAVLANRNPNIAGDRAKAQAIADKVTTDEFDAAFRIVEQRPADPT